jgi:hypothetical protein
MVLKMYVSTNIYDSDVTSEFLMRQHKNRRDVISLTFLVKEDIKVTVCTGTYNFFMLSLHPDILNVPSYSSNCLMEL